MIINGYIDQMDSDREFHKIGLRLKSPEPESKSQHYKKWDNCILYSLGCDAVGNIQHHVWSILLLKHIGPTIYQDFRSNYQFIGNTKAGGKIHHNRKKQSKLCQEIKRLRAGDSIELKRDFRDTRIKCYLPDLCPHLNNQL